MMRWPQAVRFRLALWYAGTLALVLGVLALWSFALVRDVLEDGLDHFLEESRRGFLSVLATEEQEYDDRDDAIRAAIAEIGFTDTRLLVIDDHGDVLGASTARGLGATASGAPEAEREILAAVTSRLQLAASPPLALRAAIRGASIVRTVPEPTGPRVAFGRVLLHGQPITVAAVRSRHDLIETLGQVRRAYLIAIPLVLLAAALGGYLLARRALAPVASMARRARAISAHTLHERLPLANPADEIGELGAVVNALLERLEAAFSQQQRFIADASHELRTPVAVLLAEAEVTLARSARPESEYRESLQVMRETTRRLSRIVEDLFVLARGDSGQRSRRHELLYLDELADDCGRAMQAVASQRGVRLLVAHEPATDGAALYGDPELLGRLVYNLVDNAIKFTRPGGVVRVGVRDQGAHWCLSVVDEGPGIPTELQPHIFERFVRGDAVRTTIASPSPATSDGEGRTRLRAGGAGLGLAIAQRVTEQHGGTLTLVRSDPSGSEFTATLPKRTDVMAPSRTPAVGPSASNVRTST